MRNFGILVVAGLFVFSSFSEAKSLECFSTMDYTGTTVTMNRDGSIGFNGTFVTVDSQIGVLNPADMGLSLARLTGRAQDRDLTIHGIELPLSPKGNCTPSDNRLTGNISCETKNTGVHVTGERTIEVYDGSPIIFQEERVRAYLHVDIKADFEISPAQGTNERQMKLHATVTEPKSGGSFEIFKNVSCKVTNL